MDLDSGSKSGSSAFPSSLFVGGLNLDVVAAWGAIVKSSDLGFGPAHKSGNAFGVALACFSYRHLLLRLQRALIVRLVLRVNWW